VPTFTTLVEAQAALKRLEQRYAARDAIRWAIELVEHGEMIGTVGLLRFDFEHRHAEIGYEIARRWWGRGLTPEASLRPSSGMGSPLLPGNDASVRVLQKLGFLEEGTRRDYLYSKARFHRFRWFALLETDEADHPATI
jgi:ribosomal-protein-alanine N-acetyltransferase